MDYETANRLYELRKAHGYSQDELADMLGVSRQAISKWERGESSPDTDNLIALARLYGVSLDELVGLHPTDAKEMPSEEAEKIDEDEVPNFDDEKDAFHVKNDDGSEVFIDDEKIRIVDANGKQTEISGGPAKIAKTVIDKIGVKVNVDTSNINENGTLSDRKPHVKPPKVKIHSTARKIADCIVPLLILLAYLLLGTLGGWWHPGWIVFFALPIFFCTWDAFSNKRATSFPIAIIIGAIYLTIGFVLNAWHPYWSLFFIIPCYYAVAAPIDKRRDNVNPD